MAFTPLHDRVLVRRVEGDEKTKGGLIIPDTAKEKPAEGEVISPSAPARRTTMATGSRWTSRPATGSCSASGRAPKSRSTAKTC
jgi:hypothetical protein